MNNTLDKLCMGCFAQLSAPNTRCPVCGYTPPSDAEGQHRLAPRTVLSGKYMVGKPLGEGGFGITYLGYDLNLDIKVAIKEFYPFGFVTRSSTQSTTVQPLAGEQGEFFLKGRERFVDEAKRLARFRTFPGIVMVNDFFVENGTAYIVMEYVEGETLKSYMAQQGGRLPAEMVLAMMKPVFQSLSQMHAEGLIHRDISPDNIMVTHDGSVKLLDFGAAREFGEDGNKSLSVMLKHGYAPPEQYTSRGVQGPHTDVYALCATIYKAVTGVTPDGSMDRVMDDRLAPPSVLGAQMPYHAEVALMHGLAVKVEYRWQTMGDLYSALYNLQLTIDNVQLDNSQFTIHNSQLGYNQGMQQPMPQQTYQQPVGSGVLGALPSQYGQPPSTSYTPQDNSQFTIHNSQLGGQQDVHQPVYAPQPPATAYQQPVGGGVLDAPIPPPTPQYAHPSPQPPATSYAPQQPETPAPTAAKKPMAKGKRNGIIAAAVGVAVVLVAVIIFATRPGLLDDSGSDGAIDGPSDSVLTDGVLDMSKIPDVTAMDFETATDTLGKLGVPYRTTVVYSSDAELGIVMSTDYDSENERVILEVSIGEQPRDETEIRPPIILGATMGFAGETGVSGRVVIVGEPNGVEMRTGMLFVGEDETLYANDYISNESGMPQGRSFQISSAVLEYSIYNYREYGGYRDVSTLDYAPLAFDYAARYGESWSELFSDFARYPVRAEFDQSAVVPEITGITLTNTPVVENEQSYGRAEHLMTGSFKEGKRYAVSGDGIGRREILCEKDGELKLETWVEVENESERNRNYMPRLIYIMECISFERRSGSTESLAVFSPISYFFGYRIDESAIPNVAGMAYDDATTALGVVSTLGAFIEYDAEYNGSVPAGTVISQEFDQFNARLDVLLSAGQEPPSGTLPQPIILGISVDQAWRNSPATANLRFIVHPGDSINYLWFSTATSNDYDQRWYQLDSVRSEWHPSMVYTYTLNNYLLNYIMEISGHEGISYEGLINSSTVTLSDIHFGATIQRFNENDENRWNTVPFDEVPDAQKTIYGKPVRMTISRDRFVHSLQHISTERYVPDWYSGEDRNDPRNERIMFTYSIEGDIDTSYGYPFIQLWQNRINYGYIQTRYASFNWNYVDGRQNMEVSWEHSGWELENPENLFMPDGLFIAKDGAASIDSDGITHLRIDYDLIDMPSVSIDGVSMPTPVPMPAEPMPPPEESGASGQQVVDGVMMGTYRSEEYAEWFTLRADGTISAYGDFGNGYENVSGFWKYYYYEDSYPSEVVILSRDRDGRDVLANFDVSGDAGKEVMSVFDGMFGNALPWTEFYYDG